MAESIRVVDLFCGCGGLSLGFELYSGAVKYCTVMALDNYSPALRCFNSNPPRPGWPQTGRLCDLTWFAHPSEVLLYYLVHLAYWSPDAALARALVNDIGVGGFLNSLRTADSDFAREAQLIIDTPAYRAQLAEVEPATFTLAITRAFLDRLGLGSLGESPSLDALHVPWKEEYAALAEAVTAQDGDPSFPIVDEIISSAYAKWDHEVGRLDEASNKQGRGQHKVVAARIRSLAAFLRGNHGQQLRRAWADWQGARDSIRALFCTVNQSALAALYDDGRRVNLLLGGPPCKGFSRIGRAVIASLTGQGVHAWASPEYGDERNALMHKYVLFLDAFRPDAFLFENVAHFASVLRTPAGKLDAAEVLARSIAELSADRVHFHVRSQIVRAREHCVPQMRERFFMAGVNASRVADATAVERVFSLHACKSDVPILVALSGLDAPGEFSPPGGGTKCDALVRAYTLIDPALPPSVLTYLRWVRQPAPGTTEPPPYTDAHIVRRPRADDAALIRKFAPGQRWMDYKLRRAPTVTEIRALLERVLLHIRAHGGTTGLPDADAVERLLGKVDDGLLLRLIMEEVSPTLDHQGPHHLLSSGYLKRGNDQHGDWFERLPALKPSKTIVAHIGKDTYGYIHPYEHRAISIREAARIQCFPDFFAFGSVGVVDSYAMIGNAVPPLLANAFARSIAGIHNEIGLFNLPESVTESASVLRPIQATLA